jgi:hypothetical protein
MKKIYAILVAVVLTAGVFAQTPEEMSYQAVIRNTSNALVTNTNIGIQISILQSSNTGTAVYIERHFPTTNQNGLVTLEIGTGIVVSGVFSTIDWENGPYFIKTETDLNGGANYTITGTNQLLSVPYALHAKTAETITGEINETDPVYNAWNKSYNDLVNKPAITDTVITVLDTTTQFVRTEVDASISNEIQNISRAGLTVTLSKEGGSYQDSVNTYTAGDGIDITNNVISLASTDFTSVGDTTSFQFNNDGSWHQFAELTTSITLQEAGEVLISYNTANFLGTDYGYILTSLTIDGVEYQGFRSMFYQIYYMTNSASGIVSLSPGTHTITVEYKTSTNVVPNANNNYPKKMELTGRKLSVKVLR